MDTLTLIAETFAPLAGRRLLDIGCGPGVLARALLARGARVSGIDAAAEALEAARVAAPGAAFQVARAEALPFDDGAFDGAMLVNALHHVPPAAMARALREAMRVAGAGPVLVVEPLAEGSFYAAFRCIEDETEMRGLAQAAVQAVLRDGHARLLREVTFVRAEVLPDFAAFAARIVAVDAARAEPVRARRAAFERDFLAHAVPAPGGFLLEQPLRAHVLAVP